MDSSAVKRKPLGAAQQPDKWQRISPASIIYFVLKFVSAIIQNGIQAIAPVAAVLATAGENRWFVLGSIAVGAAVILLVGAVLSYLNFKFRIDKDAVLIRSGVLKRKRLTLNFDRIQNVAFREPIYFRPLELVILTIESAGSTSEEVNLAGVPRQLAEEIRRFVLERVKKAHANQDKNETITKEEPEKEGVVDLLRLPVGELVRYGLSNNNVWVFAGIAAGATSQLDDLWDSAVIEMLFDIVGETVGTGIAAIATFAVFMALVILTLLMGASIIGSIIVNYRYHLTYHDGRYHRTRGLFERQETSVPEVKVQSLKIAQPIIAKLLSRFHLTFNQVGFEGKQAPSKKSKFIVPSVHVPFYESLAERLFEGTQVLKEPLNAISNKFITRHVVYSFGLPALLVTIPWVINFGWKGLFPLLVPIVALPFVILRKRRYGYAMDGSNGVVRRGLIGHTLTVFPFHKVQTIKISQSPGQRSSGFADLKVKLAGHSLTVPYMKLEDAQVWRAAAMQEVRTSTKAWM